MAKEPPTLKTWRLVDMLGNPEHISAHYLFVDENHGGLTFRFKDDFNSYVVATFSAKGYASCILETKPEQSTGRPPQAPQQRPQPSRGGRQRHEHLDDEIPF